MSTVPGSIFTGSSQFSSDFQNVITRAVQIASLPMQQLQNDVSKLQSQSSEVTKLGTDFSALQTAIGNLNSALGSGSYTSSATSSVSGANVATVALSGTPGVGTYTLEVDSLGSNASAMSNDGTSVTDPTTSSISDASTFTLTVGTSSTTITPSGKTLSALVDAINSSSAGVQATVVNVGSTTSPDYRLSLQNSKLAAATIQLTAVDGSNPGQTLLTQQAEGAAATYRVDGKPAAGSDPLSSDSATVTLAPGVAVTMQAEGTSTITVSRNTNAASNALSGFVTAYNAVQTEIATNRGQGTGALQGQSILMSLSSTLSQIANYATGTDGISSLTSLGLSFDSKGVMSFDSSAFATATSGQVSQLSAFLGSTSTGGFLKMANDALTSITDSTSGLIQTGVSALQGEITAENQNISEQQDRVDTLQTNLTQQMDAADAAIASMEQQYSYFYSMFQAMQTNSQNGG
jgi:flagellar hook-associated protein 2